MYPFHIFNNDSLITNLGATKYTNVQPAKPSISTKLTPAAQFVLQAIDGMVKQEHSMYKNRFKECAFNHPTIIERTSEPTYLSRLEEAGLLSLLKQIYGGCVSYTSKQPMLKCIQKIATEFYSNSQNSSVRLGCFVHALINFCSKQPVNGFRGILSISTRTIRKVLSTVAPIEAQTRGRNSLSTPQQIESFLLAHNF